ncbi:cation diffusion facilitator family transporter [Streptomyces sp. NPDC048491]|uniref:cation diffusion facilitator family transporter n=1 Tax=Streptomyces TaxID=1883 RepID=UPI000C279063|nr:cation diffusion facilitator family transporter [Streptomyces sp. CB01201]MBX7471501.1 cation diffusion facilitator family transporter [Streptomyces sp. MAG02]PJN02499.1 cation transporter [Streptomyces sp. CB01201]
MGHDHGAPSAASGTLSGTYRNRLLWTIGISASITLIQVVGALLSGSLALLADAAHSLTDAVGVSLALGAITLAQRAPTPRRTFGFYRVEIFSAVLNALLLAAIFVWVLYSAIQRFSEPVEVKGGLMFAVAVGGLAANLVGLWLLKDAKDKSLNLRGAYLEVLGDALGSVAVIVGGLIILFTGWQAADPIASIVIGLLIVPRTYGLLRDALHVLMEAAPNDVDLAEVRRHLLDEPGVVAVHDLHGWTVTSGMPVLTAHVVVKEAALDGGYGELLSRLQRCVGDHFDVAHSTIQLEPEGHAEAADSLHR